MLRKQTFLWIGFTILSQSVIASAATVSFKPDVSYPVGTNPVAAVVGDFNHDGKLDLAVLNNGDPSAGDDGGVSILFGNGDGTFQPAKNVAIGKNCTAVVAGDFDGDGDDDLALLRPGDATANDNGDLSIFLGNGDGTFRPGQVLTTGKNPSPSNRAIVALDLNGDQRLDLVAANKGDKTFSVLLGNGNGTFQSPVAYPAINPPSSVVAVDLAGNGEKDLAVFRIFGVDLWLANGDGTFHQGPSLQVTSGVAAGDFNGDKKDDLVVIPFSGRICIFSCPPPPPDSVFSYLRLGNGDGTFQAGIGIGPPVNAAGDLDGDGKLDLIGMGNGTSQVQILRGNGDGTFQPPIGFSINSTESLSQVLDVNGDGAPDLVLIGQNSIGLLVNTGTDFSISASAPSPSTVSVGQSATSTVSLSLLSAFDNPVSLACSVQPAQAGAPACSLSSNSVTFDASGKATATLNISASSALAFRGDAWSPRHARLSKVIWFPMAAFAFLGTGFGVGLSRRKRTFLFVMGLALLLGLISQLACGGGSTSGPKSTVYTILVTGASGASQHSTTVTLTVQ